MAKQNIIFDANFFICMNEIRAHDILNNLKTSGKLLGFNYYISEQVFSEIKGVSAREISEFYKCRTNL